MKSYDIDKLDKIQDDLRKILKGMIIPERYISEIDRYIYDVSEELAIQKTNELKKEMGKTYHKYLEQLKTNEKLYTKNKKEIDNKIEKTIQIEQPKKDNYLTGITNKILSKISIKTMLICNPLMLSFGVIVLGLEHNNIALAFLGLYALMWFFYLLYLSGKYITKKIIN
jgi:esterase/lipase